MEVSWAKDKEFKGEKEKILEEVERIINGWGLRMPSKVRLVLDFGLGDFYRQGLVEFWIANEEKEGYCGKFLFLFENQTCPAHFHNHKHETFFVLKGKVRMRANGEELVLKEGEVFPVAQRTVHSFQAIEGPALVLEVSKPCFPKDSIFEEERIGVL
ncbi:MAG: D-lyxose/D-mannose family sugar isomerase [bacterium]